jgi:hypothetical protein
MSNYNESIFFDFSHFFVMDLPDDIHARLYNLAIDLNCLDLDSATSGLLSPDTAFLVIRHLLDRGHQQLLAVQAESQQYIARVNRDIRKMQLYCRDLKARKEEADQTTKRLSDQIEILKASVDRWKADHDEKKRELDKLNGCTRISVGADVSYYWIFKGTDMHL